MTKTPKTPKRQAPPPAERRSAALRGRRDTDREGERRLTALARANEELEEFATIAAHDLHEPLRAISGYAQLLAERHAAGLGDGGREFLRQILDGAGRMQSLLDDLLEYSRLARRPLALAETDLGEALRMAEQSLAPALLECGGVVTHPPLPRVLADESRIVQLFRELLANAVRFRGECAPRIQVAAETGKREIVVSVADNGIGIDPRNFERVFRVFARLHAIDPDAGTGVGLAFCKRIVEQHGGRIWVESAPGRGTTFRFALPTAR